MDRQDYMSSLRHVRQHVPVTALAFLHDDVILAGEGHNLVAYGISESTVLSIIPAFKKQAIHGILLGPEPEPVGLVWGGSLIRRFRCLKTDASGLKIQALAHCKTTDWILHGALSPDGHTVAFVTAHNALAITDVASGAEAETLGPVAPGSNCILYCAQIQWLSTSHCLIASGTAFGDIIVWSAHLTSPEGGGVQATSQKHYTFSAHEGSVFGVELSPSLHAGRLGGVSRALASCSDDRTIRVWDVSDLSRGSPTLTDVQRETGFGSSQLADEYAPRCLAKAMGHVSRIWHVRFLLRRKTLELLSFGEDAANILWMLTSSAPAHGTGPSHQLERGQIQRAHSGKHIWSVALRAGVLATGGADGTVAISVVGEAKEPLIALSTFTGNNGVVSYGFIGDESLSVSIDQSMLCEVSLNPPSIKEICRVSEIGAQTKILASIPGFTWLACRDGRILLFNHASAKLGSIHKCTGKIAEVLVTSIKQEDGKEVVLMLPWILGRPHNEPLSLLWLPLDLLNSLDREPDEAEHLHLALEDRFIVTSFTAFWFGSECIVALGSREGAMALFCITMPSSPERILQPFLPPTPHVKNAITSLLHLPHATDAGKGYLHCTARDGTHSVHLVSGHGALLTCTLVHHLSLPLGPNVEALCQHPKTSHLWTWGFRSKDFVVYDITDQREIMSVECGGAHRDFSFQPHANAEGGTFVWTKAGRVLMQRQEKLEYKHLGNKGGHGREMKAIAISGQKMATGAEDTNIKLWSFSGGGGSECLQTIRKHNTGIQHLQFTDDGSYLFSSGGFEEFFVWRLTEVVPGIGMGVVCESAHPRSGKSDLRITGFEVERLVGGRSFVARLAYSDSSLQVWKYTRPDSEASADLSWQMLASGEYLTACLTSVFTIDQDTPLTITTATDGHLACWTSTADTKDEIRELTWSTRHQIHQNAILSCARTAALLDGSTLIFTGGDDGAVGITRISARRELHTLLIPRAHAAAVTGLALVQGCVSGEGAGDGYEMIVASAGIDHRLKLWRITAKTAEAGVDGVTAEKAGNVPTAVADVADLAVMKMRGGAQRAVIVGVGMDVWTMPALQGEERRRVEMMR